MSNEVMGKVGQRYALAFPMHKLAKPVGPQYPSQPARSTPRSLAADPPYNARTPIIAGAYMSPDVVAAALRQCELGYMNRYSDLLSECREKVPHLQSVLGIRELAVSGCEFRIKPKEHGDKKQKNKRATKVADYVREVFEEIPNFAAALQHLMMAVYFGRSALEIVWKRKHSGMMIEELLPIHPKRLSYAVNWRVHLWDENGNEYDQRLGRFPGVDLTSEYPDKFIVHTPLTMGGEVPTRQGLGRVLVWYALFSIWTQRDWMRFAEVYAQPWRVAFYDKNTADQTDIDNIKNAMLEMSNATTAVLPNTTGFELKMPTGRIMIHESIRNAMNSDMSKVVLGQTLTTDASPNGKSGSQALGEVHNEVRLDVKNNDGRNLSESVQRMLVRPLVLKQFGEAVAREYMPDFELVTESPEDINAEYKRAMGLVDRGCPIDVDEARATYTSLSKPEQPVRGSLLTPLAKVGLMPDLPIDPDAPPPPPAGAPVPPGGPGKPKTDDGSNEDPARSEAPEEGETGETAEDDENAESEEDEKPKKKAA